MHELLNIVHDDARFLHTCGVWIVVGHDDDVRDLEGLDHGIILARAENSVFELLEHSVKIGLSFLVLACHQIENHDWLILVGVSNI